MFKDCKCGRSIPKEWPRCGECTQKRSQVDMQQRMEGQGYRDKVAKRSKVTQLIAAMRSDGKPDSEQEEIKAAQEGIRQTIQRLRVNDQRKLRQQFAHDNLAPALKDWMEDD